jgi:two-component system phosphate regulon response regulator PhoB
MKVRADDNMEVLVFEDDLSIVQMLTLFLERNNYRVRSAQRVYDGMCMLTDKTPNLIIMDWMLPDSTGVEAIRQIRKDSKYNTIPIIMLTAKTTEEDAIHGLNNGADDYVTKPFSSRELLARIQANLRRLSDSDELIVHQELKINTAAHEVTVNDEDINLGPTEYKLLKFFMSKPGRVFSRDRLLDDVWGGSKYIDERTVDVHIRRLRAKLEPFGYADYIRTIRGAGYIFSDPN